MLAKSVTILPLELILQKADSYQTSKYLISTPTIKMDWSFSILMFLGTIENVSPSEKRNLEALLKAIETGIPLNQLYVDLTTEKQVENDTETTEQEVEAILQGLLEQMPPVTKMELLDRLAVSAPFVNYPALIDRYKSGGTSNDRN